MAEGAMQATARAAGMLDQTAAALDAGATSLRGALQATACGLRAA
jgi:hypothetical protein